MLIRDIKAMITQDNKAAAKSLKDLGVTKHSHRVAISKFENGDDKEVVKS